jgi:Leucine-rich repeat (LRR) protein
MSITILGKCYNLDEKILYLIDYQLTILPSEIGNLINLQTLWLYHNQLSLLPSDTEGASIYL